MASAGLIGCLEDAAAQRTAPGEGTIQPTE
jgi:hypothetical protein